MVKKRQWLVSVIFLLSLILQGDGARARQDLIVDVSQHLISVHPSFTGADVLLFGTKRADGDVIVVLHGPRQDLVVREKKRTAGIWVNRDHVTFTDVPGYYGVAATRPLAEIGTPAMRAANHIGAENLPFKPKDPDLPAAVAATFADALVRAKQAANLYPRYTGTVISMDDTLFRTSFSFPANTPIGVYSIEAFLIADDRIVSKRATALQISKTGLEDTIYSFAHNYAFEYGLLAVAIALMAGWLAGVIFRKA